MKITLEVKDTKVAFFMELIAALGFVEIKNAESDSLKDELLSEEEKKKIEERLAIAQKNNYEGYSLKQVNQHLADKHGL